MRLISCQYLMSRFIKKRHTQESIMTNRNPSEAIHASQARSHEEKSEAAKKGWETRHGNMNHSANSNADHRGNGASVYKAAEASASRSHQEKSEAAKKGWETRHANARH